MNSKMDKTALKASGWCTFPGLQNPRKTYCCVGCGIKFLGLGDDFLSSLLMSSASVLCVAQTNETREKVELLMEHLTPHQKRAVFSVIDSVIEQNGQEDAKIIHRDFFARTMPIVYGAESYRYNLGQIKGGNILQIFQQGESSHVTDNIVKLLQEECLSIERKNHMHQDVDEEEFGNIVTILTKQSIIEVSRPSLYGSVDTDETPGFFPEGDLDDQFSNIYHALTFRHEAAMVVVNKVTSNLYYHSKLEYVPCMNEWLQLFDKIYDVANVIFVMIVDYEDFQKFFVITSKAEIRRMVNRNVPQEIKGCVMCLDVSADQDELTTPGSHMKLEIFPLHN